MGNVYSTAFLESQGLSGSVSFVVAPGKVAVLRDLDVFVPSGGSGAGVFLIGSAGQTIWAENTIGGAFAWMHWRGRQVVEAGGTVTVTTTGPADVTLSGYLLDAP